jgi:glutamate/tyrosine decarboxylase-like PLP-dependent enzyme
MVDRCCAHAVRFAQQLGAHHGVQVLNTVWLNQVLVRFLDSDQDHDRRTQAVIRRVQQGGSCWASGTRWKGQAAMRISVSNWSTCEQDVDRSGAAILAAVEAEAATK